MSNREQEETLNHREEGTHEQGQGQCQGEEQSSQPLDEFSSFIKKAINRLIHIIAPQFGLLDALVSNGGLTFELVSLIQEKGSTVDQVKQLLEEITRKTLSEESKTAFLDALDKTQQKHASNYIRGKGERATEYGDDWPLLHCTEYRTINANYLKLIDLIDPRNGLLDAMFAAERINNQEKCSIETGATNAAQNRILMACIIRGSLASYTSFLHSLQLTNQYQVVWLLAPSLVGDGHRLSEDLQSRLQKNYSLLVRHINSSELFTAELLSAHCITWRQKEYIEEATTRSEMNIRILNIIRRGSETDFYKFIGCLDETGQRHVSHLLTGDGAVAHIVATIGPADNREKRERRIVDQLNHIEAELRELHPSDESIAELVNEARHRLLSRLHENDITIGKAVIGSIELYYLSTSLRGLPYLHEMYCNEQLKSIMQEIFIMLLKTDDTDDAVLDLRVETLRWDPSNYALCLQQLSLPILSHVYGMTEQNGTLVSACDDVRSLPLDQLPFELIEIILVQATGHLFVNINRTTPARAAAYTMATMWAVSHLWWEALSYRKYIKRLLKRSFQRICHPFECSPQHVTSLHIEGGENVNGVAVFNDELYVACGGSNTIQVFDSRPPFSRRDDIKVQGLESAIDITVCSKLSQLYIADFEQCVIWRVNLSSIEPADKFITIQWQPMRLSVNSSRLLIAPIDGDSLYLYGDDGNELRHIQLPRYMRAIHAVEKTHNIYQVCHVNRFADDVSHRYGVTEVDVNGRVIRTFNDDIYALHFSDPVYQVLAKDHVLVADRYNERIILLKADLQLKRVLINELSGKQPWRMCLTSSRLLVVTYSYATDIDFFKV